MTLPLWITDDTTPPEQLTVTLFTNVQGTLTSRPMVHRVGPRFSYQFGPYTTGFTATYWVVATDGNGESTTLSTRTLQVFGCVVIG